MITTYNNPQGTSLVRPLHFYIGNSELDIGYSALFSPIPYTIPPVPYYLTPYLLRSYTIPRDLSAVALCEGGYASRDLSSVLSAVVLTKAEALAKEDTRYQKCSVATLYICRELFTNPTFLCKTNPIMCVFGPKTTIRRKNKPKTNPNEPNFYPKMHYPRSLPRPVGAKQSQTNPISNPKGPRSLVMRRILQICFSGGIIVMIFKTVFLMRTNTE